MPIILRSPDKKVKITKEELMYFTRYLEDCKEKGFSHPYNFHRPHVMRETLLKFALVTLQEKALSKYMNNMHSFNSKVITVPVNEAEEILLCQMFARVDCCAYMLSLQERILQMLRPAALSRNIDYSKI